MSAERRLMDCEEALRLVESAHAEATAEVERLRAVLSGSRRHPDCTSPDCFCGTVCNAKLVTLT